VEIMARSASGIAELYTERPVSATRGKGVAVCGVSLGETEIRLDKVGGCGVACREMSKIRRQIWKRETTV
jgi:hypothetical protein